MFNNIFPKIETFMRSCRKIWYNQIGHEWQQYRACARHTCNTSLVNKSTFPASNKQNTMLYRVIKKSVCTWRLQYKKHAKIQYFEQFQSPTMITCLRTESFLKPFGLQDLRIFLHPIFFLWDAMKNSVYSKNPHTTEELKMAITEYIRNVDRAILNTVFEHTVRRLNKCLETGGGEFEHYL